MFLFYKGERALLSFQCLIPMASHMHTDCQVAQLALGLTRQKGPCKHGPVALKKNICTDYTKPEAIQPFCVVYAQKIYIHTQHPEITTPGAIQPSSCGSTKAQTPGHPAQRHTRKQASNQTKKRLPLFYSRQAHTSVLALFCTGPLSSLYLRYPSAPELLQRACL